MIFILREAGHPWGDYGYILVHGYNSFRAPSSDFVQLERCGPFIPPITFPYGHIVITDAFKGRIEKQNFAGLSFKPVRKFHIVQLNWHEWDMNALDPHVYPETGEPEGYIIEREYSQYAASSLGDLWELCPSIIEGIQQDGETFDAAKYKSEALCRASKWGGHFFISGIFKTWLENEVGAWVCFQKAHLKTD